MTDVDLSDVCIDMLPFRPAEPPPGVGALVVQTRSLWIPGQYLRVRFLEGSDKQRQDVTRWANEWNQYANLMFAFGSNDEDAEIRVAFQPVGNWSYIGTDSKRPDRVGKSTLNLQDIDRGTTLHEFGHAIGCVHEQSSPAGQIPWNKPVVYRELGGPPNNWSPPMVDSNVFAKYDKSSTQFTTLDPTSIMMYAIPARWTTDGFHTDWNHVLDDMDKKFISAIYPGATVNFSGPEIKTAHCTVTAGPDTVYNSYYGNSWIMHNPGSSYIDISFDQDKTYGGKKIYDNVNLRMKHLTSYAGDRAGYSPIDIIVNGQLFKDNYDPASANWIEDNFDITALMQDGANTVRLQFQSGATTNYWINSLKIVCSGGDPLKF